MVNPLRIVNAVIVCCYSLSTDRKGQRSQLSNLLASTPKGNNSKRKTKVMNSGMDIFLYVTLD